MDPLNVLTYMETQRLSTMISRRRLDRFRAAFLRGFGAGAGSGLGIDHGAPLPRNAPLYAFCEACQRICRLVDALREDGGSWFARWRRRRTVQTLVGQLLPLPLTNAQD
jgi:hypothetical protein